MVIKNAQYVVSSERVEQCPSDGWPEYAFIGRSNVGKSSLINMLTDNGKLAKTSATPGKTVLINHFLINKPTQGQTVRVGEQGPWYLVDVPGYGFAKRSKRDMEKFERMITSYILDREQMTLLFVVSIIMSLSSLDQGQVKQNYLHKKQLFYFKQINVWFHKKYWLLVSKLMLRKT